MRCGTIPSVWRTRWGWRRIDAGRGHHRLPHPEKVNKDEVLAILPHGTGTCTVVDGGLEIPNDEATGSTLIASAAAVVWLDVAYGERSWHASASFWSLGWVMTCMAGITPRRPCGRCRTRFHHSSLAMIRSLGIDARTQMFVEVTVGVQQPDRVDTEAVKASLPHGIVTVKAVKGGLDVIDRERGDNAVIANAAVAVRLELA